MDAETLTWLALPDKDGSMTYSSCRLVENDVLWSKTIPALISVSRSEPGNKLKNAEPITASSCLALWPQYPKLCEQKQKALDQMQVQLNGMVNSMVFSRYTAIWFQERSRFCWQLRYRIQKIAFIVSMLQVLDKFVTNDEALQESRNQHPQALLQVHTCFLYRWWFQI